MLDCVASFPSVSLAGCPWVRVVSANPLEIGDPDIAPVFSGYPAASRAGWDEFAPSTLGSPRRYWSATSRSTATAAHSRCRTTNSSTSRQYLNMYMYPAELDYQRSRPLSATWHRIDTSTRNSDGPFDVAEKVGADGKLIYLSLGSLGCMDVPLMQRVIDSPGPRPRTG